MQIYFYYKTKSILEVLINILKILLILCKIIYIIQDVILIKFINKCLLEIDQKTKFVKKLRIRNYNTNNQKKK